MKKYIGKPTREIRINLGEFDTTKTLKQVITELERQDQLFNGFINKSYALENKKVEYVL